MRPGDFLTDDVAWRAGWPEGLAAAGLEVPATDGETVGCDGTPWLGPGACHNITKTIIIYTVTVGM